MKRDPALVTLSHDHHQALAVAQKLRRADEQSADRARAALVAYWDGHGREHFRLEEEILFPAYAGYGDPYDPLLARALCDHVAIRREVAAATGDPAAPVGTLHKLGAMISEHVRLEERELYLLIERALPEAELAAVAGALEQSHG
jgi:hemerythrin HHE cation binding domain-containing protein